MNIRLDRLTLLLLAILLVGESAPGAANGVRELEWDELMPPDWDPFAKIKDLSETDMEDGSAEAEQAMREYLEAGKSAPVVAELDGQQVRLPGFVVPLGFEDTEVSEFLLVPYFGACIHVPPPPSNQIVFVKTDPAYRLGEMFDPVWVTGTLRTEAVLNEVGDAGYTMVATKIEPYE